MPVSLFEPVWEQFAVLLPERPVVVPTHPLGCHRRRVREWAAAGPAETLHTLALVQYDRMIGRDLTDLVVDGYITKAPSGGDKAGRSPVDRGKPGRKRSTVTDAAGVPLFLVSAGANRHDAPLLGPTLAGLAASDPRPAVSTVHLDRGDASGVTRTLLDDLGFAAEIARNGRPAPIQVGIRWVVERTQSWRNGFGKPGAAPSGPAPSWTSPCP